MKRNEFGLTRRDEQAIDATKMYYSGMTQAEIAPLLHIGRPAVSKLLTHARERGFVCVHVNDPRENNRRIIKTLQERYHLLDVRIVVASGNGPTDLRKALGRAAALMIQETVTSGDSIGVVWSETIAEVANAMPECDVEGIKLIQLGGDAGRVGSVRKEHCYKQLAQALNARWYSTDYPAIFDSCDEKLRAVASAEIKELARESEQCRVMIYSPRGYVDSVALLQSENLAPDEQQRLQTKAVGDLCLRFIDSRARVCVPDLNARTMGITLPKLRKIEQKIAVAGGESSVDVLHVALTWGYANKLVTDIHTAQLLLKKSS
ncbi:sugar-binding transcriptional regulator [Rothia sp. ZJ932]|uniref:sugar-binding transcriptional regulator n=1 Tax=Rothia sp. ZJ932 TaxID=2810516 RepID=UPI001966F6EA|nr:sugar-binding domain-containing protein [Rothia sp. ZJ932]QRZ61276.1 hypothetical protein JR346_08520 [Rothia sp. ZJ932]